MSGFLTVLKYGAYTLYAIVFYSIFVPLLTLSGLVMYAIKCCNRCCLSGKAVPMHSGDQLWSTASHAERMTIEALVYVKGAMSIEALQEAVQQRWIDPKRPNGRPLYLPFSWVPRRGCCGFYWVESNTFNIKQHVYHKGTVANEQELLQ